MQYRVKGKGNINVQAMGGQREVRGSRHRRNLLPVLAECGKCVKVWMQAQQKQPPQQTDLHVSHCPAVVCVLSCPICTPRPLEEPAHCPVGPGAGHTTAAHPAFGEAWLIKHLRLLHFVQQTKNKTCPPSFSKFSVPFKI